MMDGVYGNPLIEIYRHGVRGRVVKRRGANARATRVHRFAASAGGGLVLCAAGRALRWAQLPGRRGAKGCGGGGGGGGKGEGRREKGEGGIAWQASPGTTHFAPGLRGGSRGGYAQGVRSEEHTSELQSHS